MSAYRCSPYGISEADSSFIWLKILLKKNHVVLLTTEKNREDIYKFYKNRLPENLVIIDFKDKYLFKKNRIISSTIKVGYFIFNWKIKKYLSAHQDIINSSDVLFHRSPMSFRYFSSLSLFDKPFIFGPTGGGLKPPNELANYFSKESKILKLRNLDSFLLKQKIYRSQLEKCKAIIITLGYVKEIIDSKYHSKMKEIIEIGISCEEYKRQAPPPKDKISILFVGILARYKGAELMIKAFSKLNFGQYPNIHLDIVGGKGEEKYLKELTSNLGLKKFITFHGFVPKQDVKKFYESASIFAFPSITEANGNVFLEAMSYELPILTVNNGGAKYICPDEGAIKVNISNETELIENLKFGLEKLIDNDLLRKKMGAVNREYCEKNYDWKVLEKRIEDFFQEIIY